ncbi:MAG TPA: autotransporter-associated beta strand repeat-containing protein [Candidatus Acidoferrum sp.]|nr:autotransporter-associated beta strand repeat-containing protein [Candidatus Acidoferrum sp.]
MTASLGLMALLFLGMGISAARAQQLSFTFPTVRATIPVNFSGVVVYPIVNWANTNGIGVSTNGMTLDMDGSYHLEPVNLTVSGLPAGAIYTITDPTPDNAILTTNGLVISPIGNASTNLAHLGYETNNYHTNVVLNLFCTNVAQGTYTFYLNAGGNGATGLPTNSIPLVLQVAHIWNGAGPAEASFGVSNDWAHGSATVTNWLGGIPASGDDVVFGDTGAQTNTTTLASGGNVFTNIGIYSSVTVGSIRFSQGVYTNTATTNALYYTLKLAPNVTLAVTNTGGFSLLRDYVGEYGIGQDRTMGVTIVGTNAQLVVTNLAANFAVLVGNAQQPTLVMSNLDRLVVGVNQMGIGEYQLYPNYRGLNQAFNGLAGDTNAVNDRPGRFVCNFVMARTNYLFAGYADPDNYNNEFTRSYALSFQDSEQQGVGSSTPTLFLMGATNQFLMDSVCFIRANHATGNSGLFRFNNLSRTPTPGAFFRGTNGTSRMSVFTISDDGGTNQATSNVKATIDFSANSGYIDMLVDRLYVSRDRTLIASNQTPNVQGDLYIGAGKVDANTVVLGYQEHTNKINWHAINSSYQAYLNYCQGRLFVTNGGTFRVNKTLTLGYTADTNPVDQAQQYNTYGQITVYPNSTLVASNIVCDGNLNFYDSNGRQNTITVNQGTLVISNGIGAPAGLGAFDPRGLPLDNLTMNAATLQMPVIAGQTNIFVRILNNPGSSPTVIKPAPLSGVTVYPTNLTIISYLTSASPYLAADMSLSGVSGVQGYILNDVPSQTIQLYITTNAPKTLVWTGNHSGDWDYTTKNWVPVGGGTETNFTLGDVAIFDDTAAVTDINVVNSIVPNQTVTGVTVSNMTKAYKFTGGTLAGTFSMLKTGTNALTLGIVEQGPLTISGGSVTNLSGGGLSIGATTLSSNSVLDCFGTINGSLTSTGAVIMEVGSVLNNGSVQVKGGSFVNAGTLNLNSSSSTTIQGTNSLIVGSVLFSNTVDGTINLGTATTPEFFPGTVFVNDGTINCADGGVLNVDGTGYGNGLFNGTSGGLATSPARLQIRSFPTALFSPGSQPSNSVGAMKVAARLDLNNGNPQNQAGTFIVDIDPTGGPGGSSTNDTIWCDRWNNIGDIMVMNNLNGGTFNSGQIFHIFRNNFGDGTYFNFIDASLNFPLMWPPVPKPGLQWNLTRLEYYGDVMVTNSTMIWNGTGSGSWDTNGSAGNWKAGKLYGDSQGAVFDDSASGSTVVNLTTQVAPAGYNYTTNWLATYTNIIVGVSTNIVIGYTNFITNFPAFMPGIVVSNSAKDYVFLGNGFISGMTSLYKTGAGKLTVLNANPTGGATNNNNYGGGVIVDGGVFAFTNVNAFGTANTSGGGQSGGRSAYAQVIMDNNATLRNFGTTNQSLGFPMTINQNGATVEVSNTATIFTLNSAIVGAGALTKTGPGTMVLSSSGNIFTGNLTVNAGLLQLGGAAAGAGQLILADNTVLQLTNQSAFTVTNPITAGTGVTMMELGTTPSVALNSVSGSGTVTFSNAAPLVLSFNGGLTNYSGTLSFGSSSGNYLLNNSTNKSPCLGSASATFDLGSGSATVSNFNGGGLTYDLGGLAGGANTVLSGRLTNNVLTNAATTYSIGAKGVDTVFSGKIVDGPDYTSAGGSPSPVTVVKVGTGKLLLNGVNTFSGGTTVSNGTLGGTGSLASALTVAPNGTLSPGASIGAFTVSNNVTVNGTVFMELNSASRPLSNDVLAATGTITVNSGSTLVVTNIGPDIYNGSRFYLFNKPISGSFTTVVLPQKDPAGVKTYTWDTSQLNQPSGGYITLTSGGVVTAPAPVITNAFSSVDSKLTLTWPADYSTWLLFSNGVSLSRTDMWFQVVGSGVTNQMIMVVDPAKTNVFFRLTTP